MSTPVQIQFNGNVAPLGNITKITFSISTMLYHNAGTEVITPSTATVTPDASGNFSVTLYGTNDPAWSPSNWTYRMRATGPDVVIEYNVSVPYDLASPANFSLLLPSLPASDGTLYAAYNHTHAGGGTISPAATVSDETAYGAVKAVGSSVNYAREDHTHGSPALGTTGTTAAAGNHNHDAAYDASGAASSAVSAHVAAANPHTQYQLTSTINETMQDMISTFLVAGANITLTYDDPGNMLTIASTASGGSADGRSTMDLSFWGLKAASDDPLNFFGQSQIANGQQFTTAVWVPANTAITNVYAAVTTVGVYDGTTTENRIAVYEANGTKVGQTADLTSAWTTAGWQGGAISGGAIASQASGRFVWVGILVRGYTTSPSFAFPTGAADFAHQIKGPGQTRRRTFYSGGLSATLTTIDPTATGTQTGYAPLVGIS